MDGPRLYHAKWNSQRKTNTTWFHLYVESKEQDKQNRNRLIDTDNKLRVAWWQGGWGLDEKSEGIEKYKSIITK